MNKELEQKIVEMKFDNSDFEQKVAQSLVTLKKLRESTKMEDAGKGLDNLSKSAKNLDLSHIANGIEQLNERFSGLGVVGMTVMQRLTNAAIDMGQKIAGAITEAPRDGWKEYELNLDSIKTILNSAKGADGLPVTLDKVNQKLNELNEYSDKTIYSFSDMTNNIGKFTNAGVDLDSAVTAIQGVANVAALAGANASDASRAMYNFGQALGSGSVKLIDWKSIENANMATVDFKEQLIQTAVELGTVRREGDKYVSTTKNMQGKVSDVFSATQGFNDSLSAQWMTADVLTKTLAKYTDETTDLGQAAIEAATQVTTFSKLIDTLKESMGSGWMQSWQYIFGDFEESKQLWTGIYRELDGIIQNVAEARNNFLKEWKDSGGRDALIGSLANTWYIVKHYIGLIIDAFKAVIPKVDTKPIVTITKGFNEFTGKIRSGIEAAEEAKEKVEDVADAVTDVAERAEKFNEIVQQIIRGEWGNGQERIDRLNEAGYAFENLQNAVNELLGCEKRYETVMSDNEAVGLSVNDVLSENTDLLKDQQKDLEGVTSELKEQNPIVGNLAMVLLGVSSTVKVIKTAAAGLWKTLAKGASIIDVLKRGLSFLLDIFGSIGLKIYSFNSWLLSFSNLYGLLNGIRMKLKQMTSGVEESGLSFKALVDLVDLVRTGLAEAERRIGEFFTSLINGAKSLDLEELKNTIFAIGQFIGGALLIGLNALADIILRVYNGAKDLKDTLSELEIIKKIGGYIENVKTDFLNFVSSMKDANFYANVLSPILKSISDTLAKLGSAILPILADIFDKVKEKLVEIGTNAEDLYNKLKEYGTLDKITTAFENFKAALKDVPELITALYNSLKVGKLPNLDELPETFQTFVASFKDLKELVKAKIDEKFAGWLETVSGWFEKTPTEEEVGPFAGFVAKLKTAFEDFKTTAEEAGGAVALFSSKVVDVISKFDFRGGAVTALIGSIAVFVFRWSKVGKSASKTLKALSKFILTGGQVAQSGAKNYDAFLKIASAIGILAASIWIVASIPADRFKEACIALGVGFAAMAGVITALSVMKIPENKLKEIGIAFGGLGAGFLAVSVAAKIFASMDWPELAKGGVALVAFTTMIVAAAKIAGKTGVGAGAAFAGLGIALLLLVPSIKLFASMDTHTLVKGGAAVFSFMVMIAAAANVAGDAKGAMGAFVGISVALLLLIPSIKILGSMDTRTMLKGGAAVVALMFMMSEAARRAQGGAKGFLGMAVAIGVITASMYILAGLPWAALITASHSLSIVLAAVGEALSKIGKMKFTEILKAVGGLAAALVVVGGALWLLTEFGDGAEQLKAALGISAILLAFSLMGPAIEKLSKIPFQAGVVAAGNAMVFFGAMVICLGALGEISQLGNGEAGNAIVRGCELIGRAISGFLNGFVGDTFSGAAETVTHIGEHLSSFGESIGGFIDSLENVDEQTVTNAKNLALAILAICGADLLDALTGWLRGSHDLGSFAESLIPLTEAVVKVNDELVGKNIDTAKIGQLSEVVSTFSELADSVPATGGLLQIAVGVKDLSTFAEDMHAFISGGFKEFLKSLNSLDISAGILSKIFLVKSTTSAMIDLANALPKSGFISSFIDGSADLGEFARSMADFLSVDGYGLFVTRVSLTADADLEKIRSNIIPATQEMINLANKIKENTSIIDMISGRKDLGKFGDMLAEFGAGIGRFAKSVADVSSFQITAITTAVNGLADLNASDKITTDNLTGFARAITDLGKASKQFAEDTAAIVPGYMSTFVVDLTGLHNLILVLSSTDYSGIDNFIIAMQKLATISISDFIEEFTANTDAAVDAVQTFTAVIAEALGSNKAAVRESAIGVVTAFTGVFIEPGSGLLAKACGEHLGSKVIEGVDKKKSDYAKSAKGVVVSYTSILGSPGSGLLMKATGEFLGSNVVKGITAKTPDFTTAAATLVITFSEGIRADANSPWYAGDAMTNSALDGAEYDIDEFFDIGQDAADGFAWGIRSKAREAAAEARDMVLDAIYAAKAAQDSASPSKVFRGLGHDGVDGYILGFKDRVSQVVDVVSETGYAGIQAMQDTISNINGLIDGDMNTNPVISPVLDLSDMMSGIQTANRAFVNSPLDRLTASAAISIAERQNAALALARSEGNANYAKDLSSLIENTRKIINAVERNRYAIIDGDTVYNYVDRRMGMA